MGIQNYTGTADQNTSLLSMLRKGSETQTQAPAPAPTNTDSGTGGKTPQEMLGEYGITQDYSQAFKQNPVKSFQEIYQDVYKDLGISSVKREIEKFTQELQDFDDNQADLIQGINDDPWLTEGVRKNRIASLETKNEMKRGNLLARLELSQGLYDDARDEARFVTQGAASQYNREVDFQQDLYMHALDRAEQLEDNKAKLLEDNPADYKEVQGGLYNIKTQEWVIPPKATDGTSGLSKEETALRKEFNLLPEVKQIGDLRRSYTAANSAYQEALSKNATKGSKAAADQALVTLFNKMLDPESVVREGEYARSFVGQSAIARVQGYTQQLVSGGAGLTDSNRKDMVDVAKRLYQDAENTYQQTEQFYRGISGDAGLDADRIFKPYTVPTTDTPVTSQQKTSALNAMLSPSLQPSLSTNPSGWFDNFIGIFGLKTK